jgi:ATP-binding cassette subfamily C protein CydD
MNLDRRLLSQARMVKAALLAAILAGFLAGAAAVFQARQLSRIVAGVLLGGQGLPELLPLLWVLLAAFTARATFNFLAESAAASAAIRVKENVRDALARKLLALGPAYAQGERSGELINTATQGVEALDGYFSQYLPQLALAGVLPLAYLAVTLPLDPLSGLILLVTGPLIPFFMFLIGHNAQSLTRRQWQALGRMSAYFLDTLQGLVTLKVLGRSREQGEHIARVSENYRVTTMRVLQIAFLSALALELLGTIGTAIVAVQIGLRLLYGQVAFEQAFFILLLAPEFYQPLRALGLRFHASMAGVSAARRIAEVLEQPGSLPAGAPARRGMVSLDRPFVIHLESVRYTYPGRSRPALDGLDLQIASGQVTALVGASGAGKSTVAWLLLRFIDPQQGCIRVGDVPLAALPLEEWRARIAWVPQQPHLFHGTLADNLRIARPAATSAELRRALEQAHLAGFVDRLPRGLETFIGEGGARLSGGQAQRLAMARAFLRDAPLLVLDEPFSHLDLEQALLLEETTRRLMAGRTVLVIAHRLATARQAGQVFLLDGGQVVEAGPAEELRRRPGRFAQMLAGDANRAGIP